MELSTTAARLRPGTDPEWGQALLSDGGSPGAGAHLRAPRAALGAGWGAGAAPQVVEDVYAVPPHVGGSVLAEAFVVEAIHLGSPATQELAGCQGGTPGFSSGPQCGALQATISCSLIALEFFNKAWRHPPGGRGGGGGGQAAAPG